MNRMDIPSRVIARFHSRIRKCATGCWLWTGAKTKGYGHLNFVERGVCRYIRVHRLQVLIRDGHLADDAVVMHTCDVPCCVNPEHLRVGTVADNVQDKMRKMRCPRGDTHSRALLTDAQVEEIIRGLLAGKRRSYYRELYAVRNGTLSYITAFSYHGWKHIWAKFPAGSKELVRSKMHSRGEHPHRAKLTEENVRDIRKLRAEGLSQHQIGKRFGVSRTAVHDIEIGKNWKHVS